MSTAVADRSVFMRRRIGAVAVVFAIAMLAITIVRGGEPASLGPPVTSVRDLPDGTFLRHDWRGLPIAADQEKAVRHFLSLGRPIYCTGGRARYAALTFDDGPSQYSDRVLDALERGGAQATFFLIGRQVADRAATVRRQADLGAVGDHTWDHSSMPKLSNTHIAEQVSSTERAIENATGRPVTLFRPPYAARDARTDAVVRRAGMLQVLWDVDSHDYASRSTDAVAATVEAQLAPGSIVLVHETHEWTLNALPRILESARRKRIRLVTLPALLALDPPSDAMVRAGGAGCSERPGLG